MGDGTSPSPSHHTSPRGHDTLTIEPVDGWPTDQLAGAEIVVTHLATAARAWCLAQVAELKGSCVCDADACALGQREGGRDACVLAPTLAALPLATVPQLPRRALDTAGRAYLQAIEDAAGAVYFCRRVRHASGECWFGTLAGRDLCAEVLAISHRLATH